MAPKKKPATPVVPKRATKVPEKRQKAAKKAPKRQKKDPTLNPRVCEDPVARAVRESLASCAKEGKNGAELKQCVIKRFNRRYKKAVTERLASGCRIDETPPQTQGQFRVHCVNPDDPSVSPDDFATDTKKEAVNEAETTVKAGTRPVCVIVPPIVGDKPKTPGVVLNVPVITVKAEPPPVEPGEEPDPAAEPVVTVEENVPREEVEDDIGPLPDPDDGEPEVPMPSPAAEARPSPMPPSPGPGPEPLPEAPVQPWPDLDKFSPPTKNYTFILGNLVSGEGSVTPMPYADNPAARAAARSRVGQNEVIIVLLWDEGKTEVVAAMGDRRAIELAEVDMASVPTIVSGVMAKRNIKWADFTKLDIAQLIDEDFGPPPPSAEPEAAAPGPAPEAAEPETKEEVVPEAAPAPAEGNRWYVIAVETLREADEKTIDIEVQNDVQAMSIVKNYVDNIEPADAGYAVSHELKTVTTIFKGPDAGEVPNWFERQHSDLIKVRGYLVVGEATAAPPPSMTPKEMAQVVADALFPETPTRPAQTEAAAEVAPNVPAAPPSTVTPEPPTFPTTGNAALDKSLGELDADQRAVAMLNPTGVVRVLAGAGGGKTKTLVTQVARLVKTGVYKPEEIMLTTFTNRAGAELTERIGKFLSSAELSQMYIGTYDSLSLKFLERAGINMPGINIDPLEKKAPRERPPRTFLLNDLQRAVLYGGGAPYGVKTKDSSGKKILKYGEVYGSTVKSMSAAASSNKPKKNKNLRGSMKAAWTLLDSMDIVPEDRDFDAKFREFLKEFRRIEGEIPDPVYITQGKGRPQIAARFDDFVKEWYVKMRRSLRDLRLWTYGDSKRALMRGLRDGRIKPPVKVVFVDEAQDNARIQIDIAQAMAKDGLQLIGDARQVIYTWRGAYADLFINADKLLGAKTYEIRSNYRSGARIVLAANAIADGRPWNVGSAQIPMRRDSGQPYFGEVEVVQAGGTLDHMAALIAISNDIEAKLKAGAPLSTDDKANFCVLVKTNADAMAIQGLLAGKRIKSIMAGGGDFFSLEDVRVNWQLLALLYGVKGLDFDKAMETLISVTSDKGVFLYPQTKEAVFGAALSTFRTRGIAEAIATLSARLPGGDFVEVRPRLDRIAAELKKIDISKSFDQVTAAVVNAVNSNVEKFMSTIEEAETSPSSAAGGPRESTPNTLVLQGILQSFDSIEEFMEFLGKANQYLERVDLDEATKLPSNGVYVSTVWKAKGLEWSNVYVFAPNPEGDFARTREQDEENVRVFYVAITRARDRLIVMDPPAAFEGLIAPFAGSGPLGGTVPDPAAVEVVEQAVQAQEVVQAEVATAEDTEEERIARKVIAWANVLRGLLPASAIPPPPFRETGNFTATALDLLKDYQARIFKVNRTESLRSMNWIKLVTEGFMVTFIDPKDPEAEKLIRAFAQTNYDAAEDYQSILARAEQNAEDAVAKPGIGKSMETLANYIAAANAVWAKVVNEVGEELTEEEAAPSEAASEQLAQAAQTAQVMLDENVPTLFVGLVSCSKSKAIESTTATPGQQFKAVDLYTSETFIKSIEVAAKTNHVTLILSGLYGVVDLATPITGYDVYVGDMRKQQREAWQDRVRRELQARFAGRNVVYTVYASTDYADAVPNNADGSSIVVEPLEGLGTGDRLKWLKEMQELLAACSNGELEQWVVRSPQNAEDMITAIRSSLNVAEVGPPVLATLLDTMNQARERERARPGVRDTRIDLVMNYFIVNNKTLLLKVLTLITNTLYYWKLYNEAKEEEARANGVGVSPMHVTRRTEVLRGGFSGGPNRRTMDLLIYQMRQALDVTLSALEWPVPAPADEPAPIEAPREKPSRAEATPDTPAAPLTKAGCDTQLEKRPKTKIVAPTMPEGEAATYMIVEAADIIASHDPLRNFEPSPEYPDAVQERDYKGVKEEQFKVVSGAQALNPDIVLADTPTAMDGPPILTLDMKALGGNGRSMMIKYAYANFPDVTDCYRYELEKRAEPVFGIKKEVVDSMTQPVLVRVVNLDISKMDLTSPVENIRLAGYVRRYNDSSSQALDESKVAVSDSRLMDARFVEQVGLALGGDETLTLRKLMSDSPEGFINLLRSIGVITPRNTTTFLTPDQRRLTEYAKRRIEAMFLAKVVGTPERLSAISPDLQQKLERIVAPVIAVEGKNPAYAVKPSIQAAIDIIIGYENSKSRTMEMHLKQEEIGVARAENDPRNVPYAQEFALVIDAMTMRALESRFKRWVDTIPRLGQVDMGITVEADIREKLKFLLQVIKPLLPEDYVYNPKDFGVTEKGMSDAAEANIPNAPSFLRANLPEWIKAENEKKPVRLHRIESNSYTYLKQMIPSGELRGPWGYVKLSEYVKNGDTAITYTFRIPEVAAAAKAKPSGSLFGAPSGGGTRVGSFSLQGPPMPTPKPTPAQKISSKTVDAIKKAIWQEAKYMAKVTGAKQEHLGISYLVAKSTVDGRDTTNSLEWDDEDDEYTGEGRLEDLTTADIAGAVALHIEVVVPEMRLGADVPYDSFTFSAFFRNGVFLGLAEPEDPKYDKLKAQATKPEQTSGMSGVVLRRRNGQIIGRA